MKEVEEEMAEAEKEVSQVKNAKILGAQRRGRRDIELKIQSTTD